MADQLPGLQLDEQLCFALYRASRAMVRAYGPCLSQLGLTYPQYLTMLVLWESDGPLYVGDICARLRLDNGTVTPLLKRLEDQDLITRTRDRGDERRVRISLTAAGSAARSSVADIQSSMLDDHDLDVDAARALRRRLTDLADALEGV